MPAAGRQWDNDVAGELRPLDEGALQQAMKPSVKQTLALAATSTK